MGVDLIVDALDKPATMLADRDNYYYGMGQAGVDALAPLLKATEIRLLGGEDPTTFLPLSFLAGDSAWGPLRELALAEGHVGIRIAAIRGYARGEDVHDGNCQWLQGLALDSEVDRRVRAEALRALGHLDEEMGGGLVKKILLAPSSSRILLTAALEVAGESGIPRGCLQQVDALVRGDDEELREKALVALAADGSGESSTLLRGLLPLLSSKDLDTVITQIFNRAPLDAQGALENPLYEDVANLLDSNLLSEYSEEMALRALSEAGVFPELVDSVAWGKYTDASIDDRLNNSALFELANIVGPDANQEILGAYRESDGFVSKLELASLVANLHGNSNDPEVEQFLENEVLAELRTALVDKTDAMLAYTGPRRGQHNQLGMTVTNVFGRYGNVDDIPYLESIGETFLEDSADWPEGLQNAIYANLVEATSRASDLINLRSSQVDNP